MAAGIEPTLNLFHWDLPQALQDKGGFANPDIIGWFADYAHLVATRLGDSVTDWMTFNEPAVFAFLGHADGIHAPGLTDWPTAIRVADNEIRAHAAAVEAIRSEVADARIGVAVDINHFAPATDSDDDVRAADEYRADARHVVPGPVVRPWLPGAGRARARGGGPSRGRRAVDAARRRPRLRRASTTTARRRSTRSSDQPFDWVVKPRAERRADRDGLGSRPRRPDPGPAVGQSRRTSPRTVDHRERRGVSRSGLRQTASSTTRTVSRTSSRHLAAAADAIEAGAPLTGFFVWSLMDNFEWSLGYSKRFGVVHVDYADADAHAKAERALVPAPDLAAAGQRD